MKTFFFLMSLVVLLFACRKDKDNNYKPLYLSKVFKDGLLEVEYFYDGNKRPYRRNEYSTNNGASSFAGFRLYEYNANNLLESISIFSKNSGFQQKYRLQYDINKQISRMDDLANDNTVLFYHVYDYNAQGDLSKFSIFNNATAKKTVDAFYTYDAQRKLTKLVRYTISGTTSTKHDSANFSFSNKKLPSDWTYFEGRLFASLPNGDRTFIDMVCDSSMYYYVDAPPLITNSVFSGKQYNGNWNIIKQHFNSKYNNAFGVITTVDYDRTYEYIE
jgi:hypothetical protein